MFHLDHLPNPVPNEKVLFCLRRHPLTLAWLAGTTLVLVLMPFGIMAYFGRIAPAVLADPITTPLMVMIGSVFFLFAWLFLFQNFIDYALDMWVVTTKRILNIEQTGLFGRRVSELRLYRIQDVTASVNGFFHTMFDYGLIEIQTAAEETRFRFENVPHPNEVTKTVLEYAEIERREQLDEAVEEFSMPSSAPKKR